MTEEKDVLLNNLVTADGLFSVDGDHRITAWNESAERLLGYGPGEVLGKKCFEVLCEPGSLGRATCNRECQVIANAERNRPTRDFDVVYTAKDGSPHNINVTVLFQAPFKRSQQAVHLFRDVTERRAVEDALHPADENASRSASSAERSNVTPVLSRREDQVLRLLAAGKTTDEIAEALQVKPVSVRNHIARLTSKLGVSTRLQAVVTGARLGLI